VDCADVLKLRAESVRMRVPGRGGISADLKFFFSGILSWKDVAAVLAILRHARSRHRHSAYSAGHGSKTSKTGQKYGIEGAMRRLTIMADIWKACRNKGKWENVSRRIPSRRAVARRPEALLGEQKLHSYPQCWRCQHSGDLSPTEPWFIDLDGLARDGSGAIRPRALRELYKINGRRNGAPNEFTQCVPNGGLCVRGNDSGECRGHSVLTKCKSSLAITLDVSSCESGLRAEGRCLFSTRLKQLLMAP